VEFGATPQTPEANPNGIGSKTQGFYSPTPRRPAGTLVYPAGRVRQFNTTKNSSGFRRKAPLCQGQVMAGKEAGYTDSISFLQSKKLTAQKWHGGHF
jgi:hypothetical protein